MGKSCLDCTYFRTKLTITKNVPGILKWEGHDRDIEISGWGDAVGQCCMGHLLDMNNKPIKFRGVLRRFKSNIILNSTSLLMAETCVDYDGEDEE